MALSLLEMDTIKSEVNQISQNDLSMIKEEHYKLAQQISLDINTSIDIYKKTPKDLLKELEILVEYLLNIEQRLDGKSGNIYRFKKRWSLMNHFRQNFKGNF